MRGIEGLRARRRRARFRLSLLLCILAAVIIGALIWLLEQPALRVSTIQVFGADQSLASYARTAIVGSYFGIVPRDSILFVPESKIRADILAAHPEIAAVSIFRADFTTLTIKAIERVAIARWCGEPLASSTAQAYPLAEVSLLPSGDCDLFDGNGFVYAAASEPFAATSSTDIADGTLDPFVVFDDASASGIGATLASADQLPAAFDFARELADFGSPVESVVIRGDEVDDFLESGTRITYVLGQEQQAYSALDSAMKDLDLSDGSVAYVDLRFPGDVYVKKVGQ